MNKYKEVVRHVRDESCAACQLELEELGPIHGPDMPPHPRVNRWSMTPEEWAGQKPLRDPGWV